MRKYKVTCLNCKRSDVLTIDESNHQVWDYAGKLMTNFLSARFRKDGQWGFECVCGNDNRLSSAEAKDFDTLVAGDPLSIKRIADSLKLDDSKQFVMGAV